ncbi:MAG: SNF2-related protein [Sphingomonadaceae bacterium]
MRRQFDSTTFRRGLDYYRHHQVRQAELRGEVIDGVVIGSQRNSYRQTIQLRLRGAQPRFDGQCSCPMEVNCKHVVAVLLTVLEQLADAPPTPPAQVLAPELAQWLAMLRGTLETTRWESAARPKAVRKPTARLIFLLMPQPGTGTLRLLLAKGQVAADGCIRSATLIKDTYDFHNKPPAYLSEQDQVFAANYVAMLESIWSSPALELVGERVARLLWQVLEQASLYWADDKNGLRAGLRQLHPGPDRSASLTWLQDAAQTGLRLVWQDADGTALEHVLPLAPPCYLHGDSLGALELPGLSTALPLSKLVALVARAPHVAHGQVAQAMQALGAPELGGVLPLPVLATSVRSDIWPQPVLTLGCMEWYDVRSGRSMVEDFGMLAYDYDGQRVEADPRVKLSRINGGSLETIARAFADEAAAREELLACGFRAGSTASGADAGLPGLMRLANEAAWLHFASVGLPQLQARGWQIELTPDYRYQLAEIDDWYADVTHDEAGAGSAWLDLELGIVVQETRVPLLPVLLQLIRQAPQDFAVAALEARADEELLLADLADGRRVALPWGRIKPILRTLGELYFGERSGSTLRLPTLEAARLAELEASTQLRWVGGERWRALGHKLNAFERITPVAAPAGLQASLRPYQLQGLAWMQFLREYGLAGILADDMGLGKTIQTLSHILTEKEAGRLNAPALVVAPTSLMSNWQEEAARFAPGLRVLVLTGSERLQRYAEIGAADLVLTSYALLPRDEALLCQQPFHLLILDESQYIKNQRSKAAQTALLLRAQHRLCLTGTPLQNHLGELWSQFHFLMPGLLGDEKRFNADYRKPIEKQGDSSRNALLIRRIKPFLLRRTKDTVAKELPAKTEMVRVVELAGAQRDLYETVRLALDRKVRDEIARMGVARSQIVILDALLKLRQVCCDPRLLKMTGTRPAKVPSAKLEALMELVDDLLDEGRKLLIFSQFTSMLALIEAELQARGVAYALLTGETGDRAAQVAAFQSGAVAIFLISLKAGGVGLNLTAADTVIHYDPWWNPAAENQATDRAWRIGQDKPVFVYRLIAKGTLEEKIQALQRTKAGLADAVLSGGTLHDLQITAEDLLSILG